MSRDSTFNTNGLDPLFACHAAEKIYITVKAVFSCRSSGLYLRLFGVFDSSIFVTFLGGTGYFRTCFSDKKYPILPVHKHLMTNHKQILALNISANTCLEK